MQFARGDMTDVPEGGRVEMAGVQTGCGKGAG